MADSIYTLTHGILSVEIHQLRKAGPIQLYQILNKGKVLKIQNMYVSLFFSSLKPNLTNLMLKKKKKKKKKIPYLLNLHSFVLNSIVFALAQLSFLRIIQKTKMAIYAHIFLTHLFLAFHKKRGIGK